MSNDMENILACFDSAGCLSQCPSVRAGIMDSRQAVSGSDGSSQTGGDGRIFDTPVSHLLPTVIVFKGDQTEAAERPEENHEYKHARSENGHRSTHHGRRALTNQELAETPDQKREGDQAEDQEAELRQGGAPHRRIRAETWHRDVVTVRTGREFRPSTVSPRAAGASADPLDPFHGPTNGCKQGSQRLCPCPLYPTA